MNMKKGILLVCISVLMLFSTAFANEPLLISPAPQTQTTITVDGEELSLKCIYDGEVCMIPVRAICEKMGFNVIWDPDTNYVTIEKMPQYYTFNIYQDGYTVAKTAPIMLGKTPVVQNWTTYVPVNFVEDIINCSYEIGESGLSISSLKAEKEINTIIFKAELDGMCTIYDIKAGDMLLNISSKTEINGNVEEFVDGQILNVVYGDVITTVEPNIANALKITETDMMGEVIEGTVCAFSEADDAYQIVIGDSENRLAQTALNVSKDIKLYGINNEVISAETLVAGTKIRAIVSQSSTRSIPPQRTLYALKVIE